MKVELRFYGPDQKEEVRTYEGMTYNEALEKFHEEFPDESTKPPLHRIIIDNTSTESHKG